MHDLFLPIIKFTNFLALPPENAKRNENPRATCISRIQSLVSKYHSVVELKETRAPTENGQFQICTRNREDQLEVSGHVRVQASYQR